MSAPTVPTSLLECTPPDPLRALDTHLTPLGEAWSLNPIRSAGMSKALQAAWWASVLDSARERCLAVQRVTISLPDGERREAYVLRGADLRLLAAKAAGTRPPEALTAPAVVVDAWPMGVQMSAQALASFHQTVAAAADAQALAELTKSKEDAEIPF